MSNNTMFHARLGQTFVYYSAKYAYIVHDIIPVRDLYDKNGVSTSPYEMVSGEIPILRHLRVFRYPSIFNRYR